MGDGMLKLINKKHWINHIRWIEKRNLAVCDGMIEPMGFESILYSLFVISGLSIFLLIGIYWVKIKSKIIGEK